MSCVKLNTLMILVPEHTGTS